MKSNCLARIKNVICGRRVLVAIILMVQFSFFGEVTAQAQIKSEWELIAPLVTSRGQVEERYGKPIMEEPLAVATYSAKFGKITVWYHGAYEPDGWMCRWNVPQDVVSAYYVSLSAGMPISRFRQDIEGFEKSSTHLGQTVYTNRLVGISFITDKNDENVEEIRALNYFPTAVQVGCHCSKKPAN